MPETNVQAVFAAALSSLFLGSLCPAAEPAPEIDRFAPVSALAGRCFVGEMPEAEARDTHCWEWVLDERFLRDRHQVAGPNGLYQGETFYGWDAEASILRFWYFNSLGGVSEGTVEKREGRWFFDESYRGAGTKLEMRTSFDRPGDDDYTVVTEQREDDHWDVVFKVRFQAYGRRPPQLVGPWAESADLLFNSSREGNFEVYRRELASGEESNLTRAPGTEWVYTGGERHVIASNRKSGSEGGYRLFLLDPATGALEQLTDFPVADSRAAVLPASRGYVVCAPHEGDKELFLLDAAGRIVRQLTDNEAEDCQPDVTPDGGTIVFWSTRSGSAELWSMALDGSEPPRLLTGFSGNDGVPRHRYGGEGPPCISPDGERIAWMSIRGGEDWDVYTMRLDGTDVRRLTDHLADDDYPAWSPDGRHIAFDSNRHGSFDIFVVPAEGGHPQRLTDDPGDELAPAWVTRARSDVTETR